MRKLSKYEQELIRFLVLSGSPQDMELAQKLPTYEVTEMNDGNMGSLLFVKSGDDSRVLGRKLAEAVFNDTDGTPVNVCLNLDELGELYELDVWKVDFSTVKEWPSLGQFKIIKED